MARPFFSIIIPTYNQCNFLKNALKSVENQKFSNYEIIVIDNSNLAYSGEDINGKFLRGTEI